MNLFCFSLEGSTDSLYEPTQGFSGLHEKNYARRPCNPPFLQERTKWSGSEPNIPLAELKENTHSPSLKKSKRKSHTLTTTLSSDHEANDTADDIHARWHSCRRRKDLADTMSSQKEGSDKDFQTSGLLSGLDRVQNVNAERKEKDHPVQLVNFEAWNPNWDCCDARQQDLNEEALESRRTLRRIQKLVKVKKGRQSGSEEGKAAVETGGPSADFVFEHTNPVVMCIGLAKRPERKYGKETPQDQQHTQPTVKEVDDDDVETLWSPGLFHHGWNTTESAFAWESHYHTCQRTAETRMHNFNFTLPRGTDWDKYECLIHELDIKEEHLPQRIIRSITDLDISDPMRSSSFGKFDSFRHHTAQVKSDENGGNVSTEVEAPDVDHNKPGSIGKKMKAISLTMRKRMGKKYAKALSEEMGEMTEGDREACADEVSGILTKDSMRSCNSLESLYSLNSGQSSSSGVTSGSEGSSNRDSLRLEEETQYTGQFCGKAKVHTDFVPSPYDTESLKLKVGDMIDIIRKPPMGIWTGMLNNKVGTFKFIYVDVVVEKESEPQHRIRTHRRSKRPRPKTLQELLERLNLEDLASSLMLNGYETVEDLKDLKEQHLIELNVTNPEQRHRLLAAAECLQEAEYYSQKSENEVVEEPTSPSKTLKVEINDCPRDSGCYITSDSKEEPENLLSVHPPPAEG